MVARIKCSEYSKEMCSAVSPTPKSSSAFGKYFPLSVDFLGGKTGSPVLDLEPLPCSGNERFLAAAKFLQWNSCFKGEVLWFYTSKSVYRSSTTAHVQIIMLSHSLLLRELHEIWLNETSDVTWVSVNWGWRLQEWHFLKIWGCENEEMSLPDFCSRSQLKTGSLWQH